MTGYVGWRKIDTYIHTYIHTYGIGLSYFQKIIEILEAHFTSVNRNKVYLFVLRKISYNLCCNCGINYIDAEKGCFRNEYCDMR